MHDYEMPVSDSLELHRQVSISPGDVGWAACEPDELPMAVGRRDV